MRARALVCLALVPALVGVPAVGVSAQEPPKLEPREIQITADVTDVAAPGRVDLAHVPDDALTGAPAATERPGGLASTPISSIGLAASPISSIPISSIPISSIPISSIPISSIALDGMTLNQVPIVGGWAPILAGTPLAHRPLHTVRWGQLFEPGNEAAGDALKAKTLGDLTLASTPISSIPISSIALGALPISSIPLTPAAAGDELATLGEWCSVLADLGWPCTELGIDPADPRSAADHSVMALALAGIPISSIPISSIPISSIPISSIPISSIPISSIHLQSSPISSIPISSIPISSIPISSIPISSIPISSIPLMVSFLAGVPISSIDVRSSPISSIPISSIPVETLDQAIDCSNTAIDCTDGTTHTLGDAYEVGAIIGSLEHLGVALSGVRLADIWLFLEHDQREQIAAVLRDPAMTIGTALDPSDDVTLGELGAYGDTTLEQLLAVLPADVLAALTLDDLLAGLFAYGEHPWADIDLAAFEVQAHAADAVPITYTVEVGPPDAERLDVDAVLPDGFVYVPGSSSSTAVPDPGEPTVEGQHLQWRFGQDHRAGVLDPSQPFTITFDAVAGTGPGDARATVSADDPDREEEQPWTPSDTTVRVQESLEPNDLPADAVPVVVDELVVSRLATPTDVDLFTIEVAAGERLSVDLSNLDADYDLVLYGPAGPGGPVSRRDLPVGDQGFDPIDTEQQLDAQPVDDLVLVDGLTAYAMSTNRPDAGADVDERIDTPPLPRSGTYTLQVSAYNGDWSPRPYALRVDTRPAPVLPGCDPRVPPFDGDGDTVGGTYLPPDMTTMFVVNERRFGDHHGSGAASDIRTQIDRFVGAEGVGLEIVGGVLAVEEVGAIDLAYDRWDADRCSPQAANAVAWAIADQIAGIRAAHPRLQNVVVVGGDDIVPFGRVPDRASLSNEFTHAASFPVNDETIGSLGAAFVLTDDVYADDDPLSLGSEDLFVPEVAIGRLVETPDDIVKTIDNFFASAGVLDTDTAALVTGYDFLTDGAHAVAGGLEAPATETEAARTVTSMINDTWTAAQLSNELLELPPDIASVNAHFDHYRALPADQDSAGTEDDLFTVDHVVESTLADDRFEGTFLFSMGCHSGLSVSDIQITGAGDPDDPAIVDLKQDWAQVLASEGAAGFVGNTGFGYGDTDLVAYSEQLMAEVADRLDGAYTIGESLAYAKQRFTAELGVFSPYEEKASMEATLYGLPMWRLPRPGRPEEPPTAEVTLGTPTGSVVPGTLPTILGGPGDTLGLVSGTNGDYYHYQGQTQQSPLRPAQPRYDQELTQPGLVAKGVWLTHLQTTNHAGAFDPVLSRPVVGQTRTEPEPDIGNVAYPGRFATVADFQDSSGDRQQLQLSVGHFQGERGPGPSGEVTGLQRLMTETGIDVFYVDETDATAMADLTPPQVARVAAYQPAAAPGTIDFEVDTSDAHGVAAVSLLWIEDDTAGTWEREVLTPAGGDRWTASTPATVNRDIDYFVQVRDVHGNVGVSSNKGWFHNLVAEADVVPEPDGPSELPVDVRFGGRRLDHRWFAGPVTITGGLEGTAQNLEGILVLVNGDAREPLARGVTVEEEGSHLVELLDEATGTILMRTRLRIDTTAPTVEFLEPVDGAVLPVGAELTPSVRCTDAGSGVASCEPGELDTATEGPKTLTVETTDRLGHAATPSMTYTVAVPPTPGITGSVDNAAGTGSTGSPLVGACVDAFDGNGELAASTTTGADGSFALEPLAAGDYTIRVLGCDAGLYVEEWYDGAPSGDTATPITVTSAGPAAIGAIHLRPGIEVSDAADVVEGDTGTQVMAFDVTIGPPDPTMSAQVSVDWSLAGDATPGEDVDPGGGTLTFAAAGPFTQTVEVAVRGDDVLEDDEVVEVVLADALGATILRSPGTGTIVDDEFAVDDAATTRQDTPVDIAVTANDRGGATNTVVAVGWPSRGSATHLGDGTVRYQPKAGLHGTDSFTYTVESPAGDRETATVTVTVVEVVPPAAVADFDGDGATDIGVYRSVQGRWDVLGQFGNLRHGQSGDLAVPADYDGDRATDVAVFRPATGQWLVHDRFVTRHGAQGDVPLPADYDGDGIADLAVFRPATGTWHVRGEAAVRWGTQPGDVPVPADYDGDGAADLAVFRPSSGRWFVMGQASPVWGQSGDIPVPADYDGDGTAEVAVFRPSTGEWLVRGAAGDPVVHGRSGDVPVPADYDGDGAAELAVFRVRNGRWLVQGRPDVSWGSQSGSVPLSAPPHLLAGVGEAAPAQGPGSPSGRQK